MKSKFFIISLVFALFLSCNKNVKTVEDEKVTTEEKKLSLKGTWELKGFYNYNNNVVVDSFSNNTINVL